MIPRRLFAPLLALSLLGLSLGPLPAPAETPTKLSEPARWLQDYLRGYSGALLLIGYPTKSLTTPAFYVKLAFIAAAAAVVWLLASVPPDPRDPSRRSEPSCRPAANSRLTAP